MMDGAAEPDDTALSGQARGAQVQSS